MKVHSSLKIRKIYIEFNLVIFKLSLWNSSNNTIKSSQMRFWNLLKEMMKPSGPGAFTFPKGNIAFFISSIEKLKSKLFRSICREPYNTFQSKDEQGGVELPNKFLKNRWVDLHVLILNFYTFIHNKCYVNSLLSTKVTLWEKVLRSPSFNQVTLDCYF